MFDNYCNISDLSRIVGLVNAVAQMRGATITDSLAIELECAAERLDLYVSDLIEDGRQTHTEIYDPDHHQRLIDLLYERPTKKVVKVYEGSEESPPEPQPSDQ